MLALTWDDGPDAHTLELARYLKKKHVVGTFFVVRGWDERVSSDPGWGRDVFGTGYDALPVLGDLVALGHRVGNHTANHVLLSDVSPEEAARQLRENQARIDWLEDNDLRLFRAPGGAWSRVASHAVDADPALVALTGPVRWDIDQKDWEGSVGCHAKDPATECEPAGPDGAPRVKPTVMAARYLTAIEHAGRGIVLLHDRVGHVGSSYALDLARTLVPELEARGYVFTAPVLAFSPLAPRCPECPGFVARTDRESAFARGSMRLVDVDGDGRADVCARAPEGIRCARAESESDERGRRTLRFRVGSFTPTRREARGAGRDARTEATYYADLDGDGHADACIATSAGLACALGDGHGGFGTLEGWSRSRPWPRMEVAELSDVDGALLGSGAGRELLFADLDGDKRDDVCARSEAGLVCATSRGDGFDHERVWLASDVGGPDDARGLALGDVDGDGRADVCVLRANGIACAASTGARFGRAEPWARDLLAADPRPPSVVPWTLRLGDVNGDGRADACVLRSDGIACALSSGRGFTRATLWLPLTSSARASSMARFALGDVNGDGRADVCFEGEEGPSCALAP